ncbi:cytidylyltransferase domain-containing protein [Desulfovibrio litoralis]|uniref:Spore coat polysaccharide biosynthesis protein SpsF n=1 Tax=Desulfovibrio litoralis DSM 11393 TaxID=1121455 RepID=A0A1M7SH15_9BACT|nr:glycosyltransferase family protein [Desulfovibrio litoralis]SHN57779.1 spore coat polysaccharide biosynthesis protein SpsF [Desulfovibrio litoralis DSM 11393]
MYKAAIILQARMGSTRLPGKVLKTVLDKPLLAYTVERLRYCKLVSELILATTNDPSDEPLVAFAQENKLPIFRGSINDVLDRYYSALSLLKDQNIQYIMRITGDCPLIDPTICDAVIQEVQKQKADYCISSERFAEGLDCEVFTKQALIKAWTEAKLASEREHVTLFIRNHPELFNLAKYDQTRDDGKIRITVDEQADFELVEAIIKALYKKDATPFSFEDIRNFLINHPELMEKNSDIIRNAGLIKSLKEDYIAKG